MPTDTALLVAGTGGAPLSYLVPDAQEIITLSARAVVDGSAAVTPFLPVVQLVSDAGIVLAEAITDEQVAAGASAQVSWFPGAGVGKAAIRFDTANEGDWLQIVTTGQGADVTTGVQAYNNNGIGIVADNYLDATFGALGGNTHIDGGGDVHVAAGNFGGTDGSVYLDGIGGVSTLFMAGFDGGFNYSGGDVQMISSAFLLVDNVGGGIDLDSLAFIRLNADSPIVLQATGGSNDITVQARVAATNFFGVSNLAGTTDYFFAGSVGIFMPTLPVVNPGVAGQLWNSGGFVKVA